MERAGAGGRGRVLIVDDDPYIRDTLEEVLEDAGYGVTAAQSGDIALGLLQGGASFDVALVDINMPGMDGYELMSRIAAHPSLAPMPVIAMTASGREARLSNHGFDAWVHKPFALVAMLTAIDRHVAMSRNPLEHPAGACPGHSCQFYASDKGLARDVAAYLKAGFDAGETGIVIATPRHQEMFDLALAELGLDVAGLVAEGKLVTRDAAKTLAAFSPDGKPDETLFKQVVGGLVDEVRARSPRFRAYGEMVNLLWEAGDIASALSLEGFWNTLLTTVRCPLHCAYSAPRNSAGRAHMEHVRRAHAVHAAA